MRRSARGWFALGCVAMAINCALLVRLIQLLVEVRETSWQLNAQTVRFGAEERISDWGGPRLRPPLPLRCALVNAVSPVCVGLWPREKTPMLAHSATVSLQSCRVFMRAECG